MRSDDVILGLMGQKEVSAAVRVSMNAAEILGGQEEASRWLNTPNRALGGRIPLELLDSDLGSRQVEDVLGRIEQGVYS